MSAGPSKLLRLRNIQFYRGRRRMCHNDRSLLSADSVSVTFEFQKNDERDVTITQHCTHDATLCPVRAWAALVKRVLGHPSTNSDTPVNAFVVNGELKHIPATRMVDKIRASATVIGWRGRPGLAAIPLNSDHTPFAAEQQWQCI